MDFCENDFTYDENMYLLSDICINHFIINVYFIVPFVLRCFEYE